jgi:hypothetical protein
MSLNKKSVKKDRTEKEVLEGIEDSLDSIILAINELNDTVKLLYNEMGKENERKRARARGM